MKLWRATLTGIAVLGVLLVACSAAPAATPTPAAPSITIDSAYGHTSPSMPTAGGLFMVIKNAGTASDKLVSGKSDACGSVEIHQMVMKSDGTLGMNLVTDPLDVPAGGQLELKEGGYHIMCIQMKPDQFKPGAKINLTLVFEKSGEKTVSADIREAPATTTPMAMGSTPMGMDSTPMAGSGTP